MTFNIRVYGILINKDDEVLLSDEHYQSKEFTKFPGGGLKFGEGIKECLIREFKEELDISIEVKELIYLTDFYVESAFDKTQQVIGVYYHVESNEIDKIFPLNIPFDDKGLTIKKEWCRWKKISELTMEDVTFQTDKKVVEILKQW
ncbi:MAG: NUDIX hydrolase [Brumimicrobium sp.]